MGVSVTGAWRMDTAVIEALTSFFERAGIPAAIAIITGLLLILAIRTIPVLLKNQTAQIAANVAATDALKLTATAQTDSAVAVRETAEAIRTAHHSELQAIQTAAAAATAAKTESEAAHLAADAGANAVAQQANTLKQVITAIEHLHATVTQSIVASGVQNDAHRRLLEAIAARLAEIEKHASQCPIPTSVPKGELAS